MNNIQIKNEIQDQDNDTVRLVFSVTFDTGVAISDGAVTIAKLDWLTKTGAEKLVLIAEEVSKNMLGTVSK